MPPQQLTSRFLYYPDNPRSGGTAEVYEGIDLENRGEKVAVKIIKDVVVTQELARLAFERETKCLSRLTHPNIVRWVDAGRDPETNRSYFVTEWLESNLSEHLKSNEIAGWDDFYSSYAQPILHALKYAFEQGIIHRDIKPKNIMIDEDGNPKIVDFGIARFTESPKFGATLASFKSIPYSPPDSETLVNDGAIDVWGFAASCVSFLNSAELNDYHELDEQFQEFDVPPEVDAIFEKAISKNPSDRYTSILDFCVDLESTQRARTQYFTKLSDIAITVTNGTLRRMQKFYPRASFDDLRKRIVNDFNAEAVFRVKDIESEIEGNDPPSPNLEIVSGGHQYIASLNSQNDAPLVIKGMMIISPFHADKFVAEAYKPEIKFSLDSDTEKNESEKVLQLISEITDHSRLVNAAQERQQEEEFFNKWRDILQLKSSLADSAENRINFTGSETHGRRVEFICDQFLDESLIGQRRALLTSA